MTELTATTIDELKRERDTLAMLYDDEKTSIYEGWNERYNESDLERWDQRIRAIDEFFARIEAILGRGV